MPSFDVVSESDPHEVSNAVDQTARELTQRYDFRGTEAEIEQHDAGFKLTANSEDRVRAIYAVLQDKFVKRKLSLKFLEEKDPQPAGGKMWTMQVVLKKGIDKENAKKIVKLIKDKKMKVTPSIQGDAVRVTGKKRDDLQTVIALLKGEDMPLALSYENFRD
jgi:uncharacterized protein YajQ (UPF0234 family)